jgi:hypothetical protein
MNINFLCDGHPPQGVSSGTAGLGDNCISVTDLPPRKPRQGQRRSSYLKNERGYILTVRNDMIFVGDPLIKF